jgi:hypothetical protein
MHRRCRSSRRLDKSRKKENSKQITVTAKLREGWCRGFCAVPARRSAGSEWASVITVLDLDEVDVTLKNEEC